MAKREKLEGRELDERDLLICKMLDGNDPWSDIMRATGASWKEVEALYEALKAEDAGK